MENVSTDEEKNQNVNKVLTVVKAIIVHYLESNYFERNNSEETSNGDAKASRSEQELKRVDEIFDSIMMSFENKDLRIPIGGLNYGENRLAIMLSDKNNVTLDELLEKLETIVHEVYHSISKDNGKKYEYRLLEEGYVSYITAETIRYAIDNPIDIPGIMNSAELKNLLESQELENGYYRASAFVRSVQTILQSDGIDSCYEYMFNGVDELIEAANRVRPELGELISLQNKKSVVSPLLTAEESYFRKAFEGLDFSTISPTLVEMNWILSQYLKDSGVVITDNRVQDMIDYYRLDGGLYEELKDFSDEQLWAKFNERKR